MKSKGFTLIELVMVIVIVSIMAITVVPKFTSISTAKIRQDADILKNHIMFAQELSMTRGGGYGICFDTANSLYSINKTDCQVTSRIKSIEDRTSDFIVNYSSTITFSPSSASSIFFNTFGEPNPNNDITITLTGGASSIILKIEKNTGYIYEQ